MDRWRVGAGGNRCELPGASVQAALYLDVPRDELVRRLLERGRETGRTDDNEEVVTRRLRVFEEHTLPLLDYYRERERLITVDGGQPVDDVTRAVVRQLHEVRELLG